MRGDAEGTLKDISLMVVRERNDTGRYFCRMVSDLLKTLDDIEEVDELYRDFVLIGNSLKNFLEQN